MRKHLFRSPPSRTWCGAWVRKEFLVTDRSEITCQLCLDVVERQRQRILEWEAQ